MPLLQISQLKKSFVGPEGLEHQIIDVKHFTVAAKAQVAVQGESGCGKTTFLHLIAGILRSDSGSLMVAGEEMSGLKESQRDRLRAAAIGYIFQSFNLLQGYTCLENVLLAMSFGRGVNRNLAESLLKRVGLGERFHHYPRQLSAGQQQRVAIARALANRPRLVLADEPTGNLDNRNGRAALALIRQTCQENHAALLLVSHDREALSQFDHVQQFNQINRRATAEVPA